VLTDAQLRRQVTFTRFEIPTPGGRTDWAARCNLCGATVISTIGPGDRNGLVAQHRNKHRWETT
jgi:hypothetical protein